MIYASPDAGYCVPENPDDSFKSASRFFVVFFLLFEVVVFK